MFSILRKWRERWDAYWRLLTPEEISAGPYRLVAVLHDGSEIIKGSGLTLDQLNSMAEQLAGDESISELYLQFDEPSALDAH